MQRAHRGQQARPGGAQRRRARRRHKLLRVRHVAAQLQRQQGRRRQRAQRAQRSGRLGERLAHRRPRQSRQQHHLQRCHHHAQGINWQSHAEQRAGEQRRGHGSAQHSS